MFHARHRLPLMDVSYYSAEAVAVAHSLIADHGIDLIEVDHLQMAFMRHFLRDVPAVLTNHNIEGDLNPFWPTRRWSPPEMAVWLAFGKLSRRNGRQIELGNRLGFDAKFFISPTDAARVDDSCPKHLLPVPIEPVAADHAFNDGRLVVLWLGGFDWPPNAEAATWLLEDVWPRLDTAAVELHLVGREPPDGIRRHHDGSRIHVHGYQPDADAWRARADVLVAPLLTGSGVRVKVIEALAAGLPVVSTPKGAEGIGVRADVEVLIADDAAGFAAAVRQLAESVPLRRQLSASGRAFVAEHHSPERAAAIKGDVYAEILGGG
jgi:glycosyltransferase involved in cell wall biosynthesis